MSPVTADAAYAATNPDPTAYGLPADAPEDQVKEKRVEAAQRLMAGVAANDVYWDSRTQLESLVAKSEGHGTIGLPPEGDAPAKAVGGAQENAAIEGTVAAEQTTPPAPTPDNPVEAVAKLRAQLEAAGLTPDA